MPQRETYLQPESLLTAGRILLGLPMFAFGVQYLAYGRLVGGLAPLPEWIAGGRILAYLMGVVLIVLGAMIVANVRVWLASTVLGWVFVLASCLHLTRGHEALTNGTARTRWLEPLALGCAAWVLAGAYSAARKTKAFERWTPLVGRIIFALTLLVFGWQHYLYVTFLAALIPAWLPFHVYWIYFTGLAFVAAGLAILARKADDLAGLFLAAMFVVYLLVLHIPRIAQHPGNGDEWSSGFVALAFCGASLLIAATSGGGRSPTHND
jgi:uncharacterized membrane protein YphA (DoxX/SURF4 family)